MKTNVNIFNELNESFNKEMNEVIKAKTLKESEETTQPEESSMDRIKRKLKELKDREDSKYEEITTKVDLQPEQESEEPTTKEPITEETTTEEPINEEETVFVNGNNEEKDLDYIITDVTVLNPVGDGDVQAPDIDALLTLVDESLKAEYGDWGHINVLSSRIDENSSFALVDISTKEIMKEFEEKGITDVAIGKNLIIEAADNLYDFKVNSLAGITKFSKKTNDALSTIKEWVETEFLQEAKAEKEKAEELAKAAEQKEVTEQYINSRADLRQEIENIKMFIELSKQAKAAEEMKPSIQKRMYAFAAELPANIEIDDKQGLKFNSRDDIVEIIFGKEWVEEPREDNKIPEVLDLKENEEADTLIKDYYKNKMDLETLHNKLEKLFGNKKDAAEYFAANDNRIKNLKESYEQFNIGDIEVVFNPETYECLYSIPSAEVKDKKINLTKVPTVNTPYDTNTIIKSFVETKFGRIPSEEEQEMIDNKEVSEPIPTENTPIEEPTTDVNTDIEEPVEEAELPEEPTEGELAQQEDLPQAETGSASFFKIRPKEHGIVSIEDILKKEPPEPSSYIVVGEKMLSDEEWNDLTSDLTKSRDYLKGLKSIDKKNYAFNAIKLTNPNAGYDLYVDPYGYDYPKYIGIKE